MMLIVLMTALACGACGVDSSTGSTSDIAVETPDAESSDVENDATVSDAVMSDAVVDDANSPPQDVVEDDAPAPADATPLRLNPEPDDEIAFLYDQSVLRTFELVLSPENMAILDADPAAENYVPGTLIYDGVEYDNVGIRYKGSAGAWIYCVAGSTPQNPWNFTGPRTCSKLSLKVSFNEYDPEGRFFGVKKLVFHAMNSDASMMRERLGYGLFRQMGVASPRVVHAKVIINEERIGLYANVEYIDGRFTRSRFDDGKGNLYKEVWPTWNALTPELTEEMLLEGLRTNEDEDPSVEKVLEFSDAMQGDSATRAATLQSWMNVENVASFIAVDRTIRADDGPFHYYCNEWGCWNHNFYLYEEAKSDQLWLIPWDLDTSFVVFNSQFFAPSDQFLTVTDEWNDLSVPCQAHPGAAEWTPWQMPPACDPLWGTFAEHYDEAYRAAVSSLLEGPFSEESIEEKLDAWTSQILDTVVELHELDPEQSSAVQWYDGLTDLEGRILVLRAQAEDTALQP